jgi:N-acetylglucosaminyldiphosphoundecaprenol N-acetyl-beta-D-mannosaminyltransferase
MKCIFRIFARQWPLFCKSESLAPEMWWRWVGDCIFRPKPIGWGALYQAAHGEPGGDGYHFDVVPIRYKTLVARDDGSSNSGRATAQAARCDDDDVNGPYKSLSGPPREPISASMVLTDTLGVPVHAILPSAGESAAAAVARFLATTSKDVVLVTFANPATAIIARHAAAFRHDLAAFDMVLPDGSGMCLAMKLLHKLAAQRVSFDSTSLAPAIFNLARERQSSIVLVGGAPLVADRARARILEHFPGIRITGAIDGFRHLDAIASAVEECRPDIVICGMGSGLQEALLLKLRERGWRGWGFTCGGYLDQLQTEISYYPRWIDRANLRWAYRLAREPGRLWRRYLIDYSHFGLLLCAALASRTWPNTKGGLGCGPQT